MSLKGQKCRGMASKWHIDGIILDMRIEEKGDNNNEVFLRVTNHTGQAEKNLLGPAGILTHDHRLLVRCSTISYRSSWELVVK